MHLVDYEEENEFIVKVSTTIEYFTALESGFVRAMFKGFT
jgi:hypothetical protein